MLHIRTRSYRNKWNLGMTKNNGITTLWMSRPLVAIPLVGVQLVLDALG